MVKAMMAINVDRQGRNGVLDIEGFVKEAADV